jgi:hypothetical protein
METRITIGFWTVGIASKMDGFKDLYGRNSFKNGDLYGGNSFILPDIELLYSRPGLSAWNWINLKLCIGGDSFILPDIGICIVDLAQRLELDESEALYRWE